MDIRFACTQCGKCCHDLRVPLSVDEAIAWASGGHEVQLLCDAVPALPIDAEDVAGRYRDERSIEGGTGRLPIRVNIILVATHSGPCPNLSAEKLCGIYETRPRVCRIYPAEIAPYISIDPAKKACPPEAWGKPNPLFVEAESPVSPEIRSLIEEHHIVSLRDVDAKARACSMLGIEKAAFGNEGYAIHAPDPERLVETLSLAQDRTGEATGHDRWTIVSNRRATLDLLVDAGATAAPEPTGPNYIGFFQNAL